MTDLPPEGWFPDPLGRFDERYWDGAAWTSRVRRGGHESVDVPFGDAAPGQATAGGAAVRAAAEGRLSTRMGEPAGAAVERRLKRPRPGPRLSESMAAAGGVLGTIGLFMLFGDTDGKAVLLVSSAIVVAASYVVALFGPDVARAAALAGAVAGPAVFVIAAFEGALDGRAATVLPALVLGAVWLAMFYGPGVRGAPVLMATVLLAGWVVLLGLTMDTGTNRTLTLELGEPSGASDPFMSDGGSSFTSGGGPFDDPFDTVTGAADDSGIVTLFYALGVVVAASVLDRRGWHALATPFLAVTVVLSLFGLSMTLTGVDATGASFLVVAVGAVIAVIGGVGRRRGSIWIGTALATVGLVTLIAEQVQDPRGAGVALLLAALGLVAAAGPIERALRSTSGEPAAAE